VFYPHGVDAGAIVLPQLLTPDIVLAVLHDLPSSPRIDP
jgi:hypothetical protein